MDNARLKKLFHDHYNEKGSSSSLDSYDRKNRFKILKGILKRNELKTKNDHFRASLLYKDSSPIRGALKAMKLANTGTKLSGNRTDWLRFKSKYQKPKRDYQIKNSYSFMDKNLGLKNASVLRDRRNINFRRKLK